MTVQISYINEMWVMFVVTDQIQGSVHVNAIIVGPGVAVVVTVAAGVAAVDVVTAGADQHRQKSRRGVVLAAAAEPREVGLEAGISRREVDHGLAARPGVAVLAATRNLREIDQRAMRRPRGVAQTVAADQRRVDHRVVRRQREAVLEAAKNVRTVVLQAPRKLPEVVLPVARSRTRVDQEVQRVLRKADLVVAASRNSRKRMAERVAVARLVLVQKKVNVNAVRLVETESQTEGKTVMRNLLHASGAIAVLVALLSKSLIEVVQLAVKLIARLQLVMEMIRSSSILPEKMKTTDKQEIVAGRQAMATTGINALHVKRKAVRHVSTGVEVGHPVRKRRRVVVVLSLEARRRLEVEAVRAVMARPGAEVVQEIAARPEALLQAQIETAQEVAASQPSAISQKVVPEALQRTRIVRNVAALTVATKTRADRQVVARMTRSYKVRRGRNSEAVRGKIQRAMTKVAEAIRAVHLVHAADHDRLASHVVARVVKATRSLGADLPIETELCTFCNSHRNR